MKLRILLLFSFLVLVMGVNAQNLISTTQINIEEYKPSSWTVYFEDEISKIEYKFVNCEQNIGYDQEHVFLRLTNKTREHLKFTWFAKQFYAGECLTCDYPEEYTFEYTVDPESNFEGECDIHSAHELKIFSGFTEPGKSTGEKLTAFKLDNLIYTSVSQ